MPRKLTSEDEALLHSLTQRMLITIRFVESVQEFPSGAELRSIVEAAAARHDLRSIRLLSREVSEMMVSLAPGEREGLEAILKQRVGADADAERRIMREAVAKVLKRGTIASEKERRRLEEYADMLEVTGGDLSEVAAVRALLSE